MVHIFCCPAKLMETIPKADEGEGLGEIGKSAGRVEAIRSGTLRVKGL